MENLIRLFERTLINSLEAVVVIVAILLLLRALRRRLSPAWQYALWMLLLVKLLLPWLPGQLESELRWYSLPESVGSQFSASYSDRINGAGQLVSSIAGAEVSPGKTTPSLTAPSHIPTREIGWQWPMSVIRALTIVWMFGTVIAWVMLATGNLRMYLALRREATTSAVPQELDKLFRELIQTNGIHSRVRIRLTSLVSAPALFGIISPVVLIPRHLIGQLTRNEWECMIRHELAHLKRRDIPVNLLASLIASVHWFNPAVGYGLRSMRIDQETACDAYVLSSSGLKETYAASIIKLLEIGVAQRTVSPNVGFYGSKNQIKRRIVMIRQYQPSKKGVSFLGIAILIAAALFMLPSAFAAGKEDPVEVIQQPTSTVTSVGEQNKTSSDLISFIAPTFGKVSSPYGYRIHPITSKKTLHDGIDIANETGTDVYAAASGKVVKAGPIRGYGNAFLGWLILTDHNNPPLDLIFATVESDVRRYGSLRYADL